MNNTLTEKYRPATFNEIVGNRDIIEALQNLATKPKGAVPNILMTGLPGCGKTTAARCFAKDRALWTRNQSGIDSFELCSFEEYNASNYRGIDFVRELNRRTTTVCESTTYLNEADYMTNEAQAGLRSPLENKGNAIFILDGNDETRFIDAIKSRCIIFRFEQLSVTEIFNQLLYIIKAEGLQVNEQLEKIAKKIAEQSNGDMRIGINSLEARIRG